MRRLRPCARAQSGLSLLELLVSMALGLVVVAAALYSYVGSVVTSRQVGALSRMTQDAQLALLTLGRDLEMAGYSTVDGLTPQALNSPSMLNRIDAGFPPVFGCDSGFAQSSAGFAAVTCKAGAGQPALEVNAIATADTSPVSSNGMPTDCLGREAQPDSGVSNRYYVDRTDPSPGAPNSLYCVSTAGGGPQPLVEGVQTMRLRYGVAQGWRQEDPASRVADSYQQARGVSDWRKVVAVRVCLLMRSATPVLAADVPARYRDCDGVDQPVTDRHLYRAFHGTFAIRNRGAW